MSRVPFTLRIAPAERQALENLSKIERRPINQLLNEAIKIYLNQKGANEQRLEASLKRLKAYRKRDPEFRRAIAAFVEAETTLKDPIEGELITGNPAESPPEPAGPVQGKVREVLGG